MIHILGQCLVTMQSLEQEDTQSPSLSDEGTAELISKQIPTARWSSKRVVATIFAALALAGVIVVCVILFEVHRESSKACFTQTTVLLISLDGFRHDYFSIANTPVMNSLKTSGVYALQTMPVFPSKTFPNHYSIVTGLTAEAHGIVENIFYDPVRQKSFSIGNSDGWWAGEPIWVTARKQGQPSAAYFWPGSEALIEDLLPSYVSHFNLSISWNDRVQTILNWLKLPADAPKVTAMYFEEPDSSGHFYGASSSQVIEKIEALDDLIGNLLSEINQIPGANEFFHFILMTDHGMANITDYIYIDNFIDLNSTQFFVEEFSPLLQIWPQNTSDLTSPILDELYANLSVASPNMTCWLRHEIPTRFLYTRNTRIAPLLCLMDQGFEARTQNRCSFLRATHGFDNTLEDMAGFFIGVGPLFRQNVSIPVMPDIDAYNIICSILNLQPAPNNGSSSLGTFLINH